MRPLFGQAATHVGTPNAGEVMALVAGSVIVIAAITAPLSGRAAAIP
jgi:hypothetical protein